MWRGAILALASFLAGAVVLNAGAASATAPGYKRCGKVAMGHMLARVASRHVRCPNARLLVRSWRDKVEEPACDGRACRVRHVRHYRCVRRSRGSIVRLRCTRGRKRVRARIRVKKNVPPPIWSGNFETGDLSEWAGVQ